jgi:sugar transferase (PEP-CTERM/EpsH1 system associated)
MEKLKILFLCPQPLWPVNTGARLRNFHLANALGLHCDVTILQAVDPAELPARQTASSFKNVLSAPRSKSYTPLKIFLGLAGPMPVTVRNYWSPQIEEVLLHTLAAQTFAAVQIESIHMAPYLQTIRRHIKNPPLMILDWHNIESELMLQYARKISNPVKRLVALRTGELLHRLEDHALSSFAAHTVVSEPDREKLLQRAPGTKVYVIPNGVDTVAFAASFATPQPVSSRHTLLFVGSMDYHANSEAVLWFCSQIWPQLSVEFPNLDFKIVGRNPPASVQALTSPRISVTGTVADVRPFYHQAFAVIVPLRVGGGTRLKILEAMAAGVPVISTGLGAQGIAILDRQNILLAESGSDMAAAIRALLNEPDLAPRLRVAARALVQQHYDWAVLGQQLATIYSQLAYPDS